MPMVDDSKNRHYEITLAEVRFSLNQQNEDLRWVQGRAGQLLQFGGLIGTFVGGLAIRGNAPITRWIVGAVVAFAVLTASVIGALWPRKFEFSIAQKAIDIFLGKSFDDPNVTNLMMAKLLTFPLNDNKNKISWVKRAYLLGILALVVELLCLLVAFRNS